MCGYCNRPLAPSDRGGYSCPRCDPILRTLGNGLDLGTPDGAAMWARVWFQFCQEANADRVPDQPGQGAML